MKTITSHGFAAGLTKSGRPYSCIHSYCDPDIPKSTLCLAAAVTLAKVGVWLIKASKGKEAK